MTTETAPEQKEAPVPDLPAIELLESTHTFPGPYMFKAIGPGAGAGVSFDGTTST